jgi:iron complex transport system substrate-binding protein
MKLPSSFFCLWFFVAAAMGSLSGLRLVAAPELAGFPVKTTDALHRSVVVARPPQRIVSLAPSNTEILFAIGCGDRVKGVTTFCNYPVEATKLPKVGGYAGNTINLEAIVALQPDLVLAGEENQKTLIEALERLGIPSFAIKSRSFADLYEVILQVGTVTDRKEAAQALVASMRARVASIQERVAKIPPDQRVRVYWEVFDEPVMSAGPRSIIGQLITLAGGINIFDDVAEDYPHVSTEVIVARDPQVILAPSHPRAVPLSLERIASRPGWADITAVKKHRFAMLPADPTSRPGPRLVEGLELFAEALYPALFPKKATP